MPRSSSWASGTPLHLAVDRLHRTREGAWSAQGLSLVADPREAVASLTLRGGELDLEGSGLDTSGLDPADAGLLPLDLDEMRESLERATDSGTREEKIHALNLDYMAKSMSMQEAERILPARPGSGPTWRPSTSCGPRPTWRSTTRCASACSLRG